MKRLLFFALLLVFTPSAFAIKVIGNGGDAVIYPDGRIEMLDLYEARDLRQWKVPDFTGMSFEKIAEQVLNPLKGIQPSRAERWHKAVLSFEKNADLSKDPLPDVKDSRELALPRGAVLQQVAILSVPASYKVFEVAWKSMNPLNRFILALHETIYMEAAERGAEDSILVRALVGRILSGQMISINEEEWVKTAVQTRLQSIQVSRGHYRAEVFFHLQNLGQKATQFFFDKGRLMRVQGSAGLTVQSSLLPAPITIQFEKELLQSSVLLNDRILQVKPSSSYDSLIRLASSPVFFTSGFQQIKVNAFSFDLFSEELCTDGLFMTTLPNVSAHEEFFSTNDRVCLTAKNFIEGLFIKNTDVGVNINQLTLYLKNEKRLKEFFLNAPLRMLNAEPVKVSKRSSTYGFVDNQLFEVTSPVGYVDAQTDLQTTGAKDSALIFNGKGKLVGAFCVDGYLTTTTGTLSGTCLYFNQYSSGKWR